MSEAMIRDLFNIEAGDYALAGQASAAIKRKLKQLGVENSVLRRVAIASYEVELNLVIHSMGGTLTLEVTPTKVSIHSKDVGPGIHDIEKAMTEGYSTAGREAQAMGFGAGMGLPNMARNASEFIIESKVGLGTSILMTFDLLSKENA